MSLPGARHDALVALFGLLSLGAALALVLTGTAPSDTPYEVTLVVLFVLFLISFLVLSAGRRSWDAFLAVLVYFFGFATCVAVGFIVTKPAMPGPSEAIADVAVVGALFMAFFAVQVVWLLTDWGHT